MSNNCFFPWCLPKSLEFFMIETPDCNEHAKIKASILKVDKAGVLQLPRYRRLRKEQSPLLQACWDQDWKEVLWQCHQYPQDASHMTQHSGRTALHLATFNHPCPLPVAQALLKTNRHMVLVQDATWYTPLHNVAFFSCHGGESLIKPICDTAIMVEQELEGKHLPPLSGTSPLFLAAKRAAPLRTLRQLLETRQHTQWIAPSTGAEPYWMETLDEYSSPLEILLRDRAVETWGLPNRRPPSTERNGSTTTIINDFQQSPSSSPPPIPLRPRVLWQMKQIAIDRLRTHRGVNTKPKEENAATPAAGTKGALLPLLLDAEDDTTTEEELEALSLWTKCVELLAKHVPLLCREISTQAWPQDHQEESEQVAHLVDEFAFVHCVASAKVPLANLLQVALWVFPEQALRRDEYGMLPLHHVLYAKHPYATKTLLTMILHHAPEAVLYSCPHHAITLTSREEESKHQSGYDDEASNSSPPSSISPLHLALELGSSLDLIKELLWADSDVILTTIHPVTGLYPFAVAAHRDYDLDVVYTLLNAHPQVLKNHHSARFGGGESTRRPHL